MTTLGNRKFGQAFKSMKFYSQPQSSPEPFFQTLCTTLCPNGLYFVSWISVTTEQLVKEMGTRDSKGKTAGFQMDTNYDDTVTKESSSAEHHVKISLQIFQIQNSQWLCVETEAEMWVQ